MTTTTQPDTAEILGPIPPHDLDAERSVLGSCLLAGRRAVEDVTDTGLDGGDFYRPLHEAAWDVIRDLHATGEAVDAITFAAALQRRGELARFGGPSVVHDLVASVPTAGNVGYYATIVRELAHLRRLAAAAQGIHQAATTPGTGNAEQLAAAAQSAVAAVAEGIAGRGRERSIGDDLDDLMEELEHGGRTVVPSGMTDLDVALSGGLEPGTVTVLAARPGIGKSAVLGQIVLHAVTSGLAVAQIHSLEMARRDWLVRGTAHLGRVDYGRLQKAMLSKDRPERVVLTEAEWRAVAKARHAMETPRLSIPDRRGATVSQIMTDARRLRRTFPDSALVVGVDYLGLCSPADRRVPREQQVAQMMRDIKLGAGDLDAIFIVLSQLNRSAAGRADKRPTLTDLRESGSIEQDADNVVFLHRDEDAKDPTEMFGSLAKARRGQQTGWRLDWQGCYQTAAPARWTPTGVLGPDVA